MIYQGNQPGNSRLSRRRLLGALAGASVAALTLAACGGSAASTATSAASASAPASSASAAVATADVSATTTAVTASTAAASPAAAAPALSAQTIQWLMRSSPTENPWEQKQVIPGFNAVQPDIKVQLIIVPFNQVDPKLTTMIASGTPPDVFSEFGQAGFGDYFARGLLRDLTPLIARDHFDMGRFLKGIPELYQRNGKYYHMPQVTNFGEMIFYNKDLFDKAGVSYPTASWDDASWTWDAFMSAAAKLTANVGQGANAQYGADLGTLQNIYMSAYLWGGDPWLPETYTTGLAQSSQLTAPAVVSSVQAVVDGYYKQRVAPSAADAQALSQLGNIFATGKIGMTIGLPTQAYGSYKSAPFKWGIAPLPKKVSNKHSVFNGCWFIEQDSKHVDASWELLKYLVSDKAATAMSTSTGFVAPLQSAIGPWLKLFEGPTGMKPADIQTVIVDSNKNSVENVNHLFVGWTEISNTLTQSLSGLWLGKTDAQTALTAAKGPIDTLLAKTYATYHK